MPSLIRGLADVMTRPVIPWADAASRKWQGRGGGWRSGARPLYRQAEWQRHCTSDECQR